MLSNLSDLLFSRVDPDPVQTQSQTSMVAMSPQSQARASAPMPEAKYLQAGQPVKQFNAMTANMSATNPTGDENNPYKQLLKGKYGTKEVNSLTGQYETEEDSYRRMLLGHKISGQELDKRLYEKERVMDFRSKLPDNLSRKEKDQKAVEFLNRIQKEGPVAW